MFAFVQHLEIKLLLWSTQQCMTPCLGQLMSNTIVHVHLHLANAYIQNNIQMKTIEAIKPTKEQ